MRLLIVVLTLVGAIPVRICTCGAHDHPPFGEVVPPVVSHTHTSVETEVVAEIAPFEKHDPECHCIKPRPLITDGLQFEFVNVPPLDCSYFAVDALPTLVPIVGDLPRDFHPPPNRPLFLTILVLRN